MKAHIDNSPNDRFSKKRIKSSIRQNRGEVVKTNDLPMFKRPQTEIESEIIKLYPNGNIITDMIPRNAGKSIK